MLIVINNSSCFTSRLLLTLSALYYVDSNEMPCTLNQFVVLVNNLRGEHSVLKKVLKHNREE
jgi:hypothetical protein